MLPHPRAVTPSVFSGCWFGGRLLWCRVTSDYVFLHGGRGPWLRCVALFSHWAVARFGCEDKRIIKTLQHRDPCILLHKQRTQIVIQQIIKHLFPPPPLKTNSSSCEININGYNSANRKSKDMTSTHAMGKICTKFYWIGQVFRNSANKTISSYLPWPRFCLANTLSTE